MDIAHAADLALQGMHLFMVQARGGFIQQFNAKTAQFKGQVVGCVITTFSDRTFTFEIKSSPASTLLAKSAGAEKGSGEPNKNKVGKVTKAQVAEIAKLKVKDLNAATPEAAARVIEGTARSMGLEVVG